MYNQIDSNRNNVSQISGFIQVPETKSEIQVYNDKNFVKCSDVLVRLAPIKNICKVAYYCSSIAAVETSVLQGILKNLCDETQNLIDAIDV